MQAAAAIQGREPGNNMSRKILIVDDDQKTRLLLKAYLEKNQYEVILAFNGESFTAEFNSNLPHLSMVILDVMLPDTDGFALCKIVRQRSNVPIIMLTASSDETDRIVGLELGADDYIAKPCELRELMARIRSVLRRSVPLKAAAGSENASNKAARDQLVRFGTKWLDLEAQALRDDEGNEHPLTASEFGLLKVFAANPKRVLSRERLLELANARDSEAFDRAVDLRIMRIRRKIEPDPTKPAVIRTIRGGGYLFSPASEKA